MELVKRVDVNIDNITGKLIFTENPEGNAQIQRGKVTKEEFPHITDFCKFFQEGCPSTFTVSYFISGKSAEITVMSHKKNDRLTFRVDINDKKGIFGHYELLKGNNRWEKGEYQMFYYHWNSEINSMKLFEKVFEYFDYFNPDDKAIRILEKIYPDATDIYYRDTFWEKEQYVVKYGQSPSRRFVFQYYRDSNSVKLVGYLVSGEYSDYLESIDQLENQIKRAQETIEELEVMQEIMNLKNIQQQIEKGRTKEEEVRANNLADLPRLKAMPRIPELQNLHTRELLNWLKASRVRGYEYYSGSDYTQEQIKAELSHREHIPNKLEAKKIRREKAKRN